MHIAVIGSGYVGLVTGACFAEFGDDVTCVDVDAEKVARLSRGEMTLYEPGLVERHLTARKPSDLFGIHIYASDIVSELCKTCPGDQSYVAGADDSDVHSLLS